MSIIHHSKYNFIYPKIYITVFSYLIGEWSTDFAEMLFLDSNLQFGTKKILDLFLSITFSLTLTL